MTHSIPAKSLLPLVDARGWPWLRHGVIPSGPVTRVLLAPLSPEAPDLDTLLEPFDVVREPAVGRARAVSRHWLRRWIAGWPATAMPALEVTAGVLSPFDCYPQQLSPALALIGGRATRLVLADEVGAGKTIEAGLVIGELAGRKAADRVVVLTPSTIRDQWADEVSRLCGLSLDVVDRGAFRKRCRSAPPGFGPFDVPSRVVLSLDLAKRPDVLAHLVATTWDVLVVDEAHTASGDSARMAAVSALARRARVVVLATATPHGGDPTAYARLCRIGELGEGPPLVFQRRAPRPQGHRAPRAGDWSPRRTPAEREMTDALMRYVRALDRSGVAVARLIAIVLRKRALSSPQALAASLRHRERWLDGRGTAGAQPCLPFEDDEEERGDTEQPASLSEAALLDSAAELALLRDVTAAAVAAGRQWSKVAPLLRVLRCTREHVLVFTEYRDTLDAIVAALPAEVPIAVLHGGLTRRERAEAVAQFVGGARRVLVATDVAAEGLNLQRACRLVVHLELPWSPTRLIQRNGRVDRIGQLRRVHVWRLLGDRRHERRVVATLAARLERMREAGLNVGGLAAHVRESSQASPAGEDGPEIAIEPRAATLAEELRLVSRLVRACWRSCGSGVTRRHDGLAWLRLRSPVPGLASGVIVVCLLPSTMRGSRPAIVAVRVELHRKPPLPPRDWLPALAERAVSVLGHDAALVGALSRREFRLLTDALAEGVRADGRWQASLFERRTARVVAAARDRAADRIAAHRRRLSELDARCAIAIPVLALLAR